MRKSRHFHPPIEGLEIIDAASDGRGVGRHEGRVVFVPYTAPGDIVDVRIVGVKKKMLEGKVTKMVQASSQRTEPVCQHFGVCGGCKWQHIGYEYQILSKQKQVNDVLTRISGLSLPTPNPILGAQNIWNYRNKMVYTFAPGRWLTEDMVQEIKNRPHQNTDEDPHAATQAAIQLAKSAPSVGFHVPGKFDSVVHVETCHLQDSLADSIRLFIHEYAQKNGLTYHDIRAHQGFLRNVMIRNTRQGDWMVMMVFGENHPQEIHSLMTALKSEFSTILSWIYIINEKMNDSYDDQDVHVFSGEEYIVEQLGDFKFKVSPKSFFQTNTEQAEVLYRVVEKMAGLSGTETVYDLYSGTGSIGIFLSGKAKTFVGVEYVEDAVKDAWKNAELNNITHGKFYAGDMKDILNDAFIQEHGAPDVLITDPPRTGMHTDVVKKILEINAPKVVYVSCNPATQARDLELLAQGYDVVELQPVDLFPHTHHVENVALLISKTSLDT